jgi:hypothetical protein
MAPPIRFLVTVVGGWACLRAALLWLSGPQPALADPRPPAGRACAPAPAQQPVAAAAVKAPRSIAHPIRRLAPRSSNPPELALQAGARPPLVLLATEPAAPAPREEVRVPIADLPAPRLAAAARLSRWSASAWLFARAAAQAGLAPGGSLGGSQAGARLFYRLAGSPERPLGLSARLTAGAAGRGAEAALGIDWKPLARLPLHLLAERRQAMAKSGRSDFALAAYGGIYDAPLAGRLRLDVDAQGGVVGIRTRDLFADGSARLSLPLGGRFKLGAGAWAAVQPGLGRVDVGPQASYRLSAGPAALRIDAQWRWRVAGNARPGSGPALVLSTGF